MIDNQKIDRLLRTLYEDKAALDKKISDSKYEKKKSDDEITKLKKVREEKKIDAKQYFESLKNITNQQKSLQNTLIKFSDDSKNLDQKILDNLGKKADLNRKLPPNQRIKPIATAQGDPHFTSFWGTSFDIQPVGDVCLLKSNFFQLQIHIRCHKYSSSYVTYATGIIFMFENTIIEYDGISDKIYIDKQMKDKNSISQIKKLTLLQTENCITITYLALISLNVISINNTLTISVHPSMDLLKHCQSSILGSLNFKHIGKIIKTPKNLFTKDYDENALINHIKNKIPHFPSKLNPNDDNSSKIIIRGMFQQNQITEMQMNNMLFDLENTPPEIHEEVMQINIIGTKFINENNKSFDDEDFENDNFVNPAVLQKIEEFKKIILDLKANIENFSKEEQEGVESLISEITQNAENISKEISLLTKKYPKKDKILC